MTEASVELYRHLAFIYIRWIILTIKKYLSMYYDIISANSIDTQEFSRKTTYDNCLISIFELAQLNLKL